MISYYKIAKWIIGQDVEHSINSEDIKEIAKEEFGVSLTKTGVKKVKEELLKQGYNQKINDSINNFKPFKDIIRKYTTISNEMGSKQLRKDGFKYYLSLYVPMGTLSEELENELKAKASEMEGYEVKIVPEKYANDPVMLRAKYGLDYEEYGRAEDAIYIYHTVKKVNDSVNDLWKVSVEVHSGHSEYMTKSDLEKGNSVIDRFAELYGVKKQATFFKDFYIGSETDVKLFADAIEKRLDDYLWIVGQPSQVTEKDREKLKIKDSVPDFTEKDKEAVRQWYLEVFEKVYTEAPLNISMLNILNSDDYFLGIFAGMYDILEDMRYNMVEEDETKRAELKELYRRGKRLYNKYSMRKFKDSADWETLKKSKDFVLKRLFEELEQEKSKPMSVEKENNIADIKSQIRKRAKEVRHVPNDIYDSKSNVGKKISWDRRALYGTILSENDPLTNKTTIEEFSTGKVYFVSTRLLNKAIEKGEARLTDRKFRDSGDVEYVVYDYTGNDYYCESLEEVKDTIKGLKDYACIEAYFPNGKEHFETYEELKNFIDDYENYKLEDANLTRKQKLWYAEELQKFIEPQYLRRNYQLRRLKNKRRRK